MMRVFAWPALAEEDDVVPGEQRVLELGQDGVLVAEDAVERAARPAAIRAIGVAPDLFLDGDRLPARLAELAEGCGT